MYINVHNFKSGMNHLTWKSLITLAPKVSKWEEYWEVNLSEIQACKSKTQSTSDGLIKSNWFNNQPSHPTVWSTHFESLFFYTNDKQNQGISIDLNNSLHQCIRNVISCLALFHKTSVLAQYAISKGLEFSSTLLSFKDVFLFFQMKQKLTVSLQLNKHE